MHEYVEYQLLTQAWAKALSDARIKESVLADRMNSFLKGNGCMPSLEDVNEVEELWGLHVQKRNELNRYIANVVKRYEVVQ